MDIAITGGTGFVGQHLTHRLVSEGHHVYILTRHPTSHEDTAGVTHIGWLKREFNPETHLPKLDAIVNLAGESLNSGRWTEERKREIMDSRIKATEGVMNLIHTMTEPPEVLVNASAVGFYGPSTTKTFTEDTETPGDDFLAHVAAEWEERAEQASKKGVRTTFLRFGLILGEQGALPKMAMPYKMMVGGRIGSGEQWMSWVHIDDVVGLITFAIKNKDVKGAINVTAPQPKRNKDFGETLGDVLHRPHWMPAPSFALKTSLGEMSTLLLEGQSVVPKKATALGYTFRYPELKPALENLLSRQHQ
ncbi:TIGR01777 family oxidoreductase [Thalassobacillus sp. CUG 92003]|uniref:TIGR01777 family oxidoreductase n=1 Tax=Thalassobacillus sp. CUG 92003 TaxID=2736641 RepID=UPI0015E77300|nr:TIGR01777 family oxidoreductase [Thalassobacillus sp. CUG 92003]